MHQRGAPVVVVSPAPQKQPPAPPLCLELAYPLFGNSKPSYPTSVLPMFENNTPSSRSGGGMLIGVYLGSQDAFQQLFAQGEVQSCRQVNLAARSS